MGKKHKTLTDDIFRNSKYIETISKQVGCSNFKKEYKEQYNFMYDTFNTLILLNNIFFSDNDNSIDERITEALELLEKYLFESYNESDKRKYSIRYLQSIVEKYSTYLYRKIDNWHYSLECLTTADLKKSSKLNILSDIEEEMKRLENVAFDNVVKSNINYEKNKNSDYKIYLCAFDSLNANYEQLIEKYRNDFNEMYGKILTDNELEEVIFLYTLVAQANNGIVNLLTNNKEKEHSLNKNSSPTDIYNTYLDTLHIKVNYSKMEASQFCISASQIYANVCQKHIITFDEFITNYNFYFFTHQMENIVGNDELSVSNDLINNLIDNLKLIYSKIKEQDFNSALDYIYKIIQRNEKYYIRVS